MSVEKIVNYLKKQNKKISNQRIGLLDIIFVNHFLKEINFNSVFEKVNQLLPDYIIELVDIIYIGEFDYFKKRDITALYLDGAIYISNQQDNEEDLLDDIIHEYAHAVEDGLREKIYSDGMIERNFLSKRERLDSMLEYEGYDIDEYDLDDSKHNEELTRFLKDHVGFEKLNNLTKGLFLGAYSTTSLREYFARGFEEFYLGDRLYLKKVCPYIFSKLSSIEDATEENDYEF